ncbi:hypothetical protein JCM10207_001768 [Rhodosporidiobolus poonsookiae]
MTNFVSIRMHTFPTNPAPFLDEQCKPRMPWRDYFVKVWEPWLRRSYAADVPHFLRGPEVNYLKQLDPYMLNSYEKGREGVLRSISQIRLLLPYPALLDRLAAWQQMPRSRREEIILALTEKLHVAHESAGCPLTTVNAPEVTLDELCAENGCGMVTLALEIWTAQEKVEVNKAHVEFPIVPNESWEHLWQVGRYAPALPLSRPRRRFSDSAIVGRLHHLILFLTLWSLKVRDPSVDIPYSVAPPPMRLTAKTGPMMVAVDAEDQVDYRKKMADAALAKKDCEHCGIGEFETGRKHLCCSKCKDVGRRVFYCSKEHQKLDWPHHRRICGKTVDAFSHDV